MVENKDVRSKEADKILPRFFKTAAFLLIRVPLEEEGHMQILLQNHTAPRRIAPLIPLPFQQLEKGGR